MCLAVKGRCSLFPRNKLLLAFEKCKDYVKCIKQTQTRHLSTTQLQSVDQNPEKATPSCLLNLHPMKERKDVIMLT